MRHYKLLTTFTEEGLKYRCTYQEASKPLTTEIIEGKNMLERTKHKVTVEPRGEEFVFEPRLPGEKDEDIVSKIFKSHEGILTDPSLYRIKSEIVLN